MRRDIPDDRKEFPVRVEASAARDVPTSVFLAAPFRGLDSEIGFVWVCFGSVFIGEKQKQRL